MSAKTIIPRGFSYLGGNRWSDITRDERFFCQRLYTKIENNVGKFINHINDKTKLNLPLDVDWEPSYEVCFYRDLWYYNKKLDKKIKLHSPKRTFDLCLFSENRIIIIEAKAQQAFDKEQMELFKKDFEHIQEIAQNVTNHSIDCIVLGLVSNKYSKYLKENKIDFSFERGIFDPSKMLNWEELSELYDNDPVLKRADEVFEENEIFTYGKNNEGYMTGEELQKKFTSDPTCTLCVGRNKGLSGNDLKNDITSGKWRQHRYETKNTSVPPNGNWFTLADFILAIEKHAVL